MTGTWPTVELAKLATVLSGFAFDSTKFSTEAGMPLVRIRDVSRGWSDTYFNGDCDPKFIVNDGDLLVGMDGQFNRELWRGGKALLNQRVCRITSDGNNLDQRYLYHFLPQALRRIEDATPFVTVKHLSAPKVKGIQVPLPPLEEQLRIAAILDQADALRVKRRAALAELETLKQSIFLDMFGDPTANSRGWPEDKVLDDVADIVSGITKGRKLNGASTRQVPYLAVVNVQDRRLALDTVKMIEATQMEIDRYHLESEDLLLTEGGDPDKLGRGSLWNSEIPECIHQNHIFRVRLTDNSITPLFLNWLIGSQRGKRYFLRSAKQTTGIASINLRQLRAFPIFAPPLALQYHFAKAIDHVSFLTSGAQQALTSLDTLFASLQHRAFRGDL